ncbi:MAG TPA: hypothetical protein IAB47_03540 [Candidatus Scatomorpha merdigallinarum]|nr:hypothetical protein [Candidatus Scatomorpha merdigallinarum]
MLWNILGAAAIAALLLLLVWSLRGLMLTPVRPGNTTHVTVRLDVGGTDNQLERAVAALRWLDSNGTLPCDIEIHDLGMDEATRAVAEALTRSDERITLVGRHEEGD